MVDCKAMGGRGLTYQQSVSHRPLSPRRACNHHDAEQRVMESEKGSAASSARWL